MPRARKSPARKGRSLSSGDDLSPMSLLQGPDEPKPEPMPGPQLSYGCSNCHHLPLSPNRLFLAMAAVMAVLSGAILTASMQIDSLSSQVTAFNGPSASSR